MSVKWGILGTSPISVKLAQAILASKTSELVAVASRSKEKAAAFAARFGLPFVCDDAEALLANPEIDAVYIGLPNHLHKEWIIRAALAGKHILCEKPFVMDMQEAREVEAVLAQTSVMCMEAIMYRSHPLTLKLCELMREKILGDVKLIHAVYAADIKDLANPIGSSAILNLGCYPASLIRLLVGQSLGLPFAEPNKMLSSGVLGDAQRDHQASTVLHFNRDIVAIISTADDMGMFFKLDIYGGRGHLHMQTNPWMPTQAANVIHLTLADGARETIHVQADKPLYTYQIDTLNRLIREGKNNAWDVVTWDESLGNVALLEHWRQQVCAD